MKLTIFTLLLFIMTTIGCKNEKTSNQGDSPTETTTEITPEVQPDNPWANALPNGTPVYHAVIGITLMEGPRPKFIRDTLVYALQGKYAYIDTDSELHVTDNPNDLTVNELNEFTPYVMKMTLYDGAAPTGNNFQVINVGFNVSEATNVSRAEVADRPRWYDWDKKVKMNNFPNCTTADVSCKAQNLLGNVVRLTFM